MADTPEQMGHDLAVRLLAELWEGRRVKVGLDEIEEAAAELIAPTVHSAAYRDLVNWAIVFLVELAAAAEGPGHG